MAHNAAAFAPLLVLAFPVMWLLVCSLLAQWSGWALFAKRFPALHDETGLKFRFASGGMGSRTWPVRYGTCLFITVNQRGFGLSIFFPFRFCSPPMFVPWAEVMAVEQTTIFTRKCTVVELRGFERVMIFRGPVAAAIEAQFNQTR